MEKTQPAVLTKGVDLPHSPEEVFQHLHLLPGFFFLDSGLSGHPLSRVSYFGVNPHQTLRSRGNAMDIVEGKKISHLRRNPLFVLNRMLHENRVTATPPLIPFIGGGVGYLGYELGHHIMDVPSERTDDLGLPDMFVGFYNTILAFDHTTRSWIASAMDLKGGKGPTVRKRMVSQIDKLVELAKKPHTPTQIESSGEEDSAEANLGSGHSQVIEGLEVRSTMNKQQYLDAVASIKEHISAGDIYQANLTQRWSLPFDQDPGVLYAALRKTSPAPFGIYLNTGECVIAGASPEGFLSLRGRTIETRPIKGTRPRGTTSEEDERLKQDLLQSSKDRSELTMIADLERNDLGRVSKPGSIEVEELYKLETFSNVHHLVSIVRGELTAEATLVDVLESVFPGGSITGAPKQRAMEILDAIEGRVRGPYTGAMGFFGYNGTVELNIAIRTLVLAQEVCHLGVGSGIVADSLAESEYEECVAKAKHLIAAIRQAEGSSGK